MFPEMVTKANLKWSPRICLTSTPAAPPIMPIGQPGLLKSQEKPKADPRNESESA